MAQIKSKEQLLSRVTASHKRGASTAELVLETGLSRQRVSQLLSQLVEQGLLKKDGSTKMARYFLANGRRAPAHSVLRLIKTLKGLEEDRVFSEISLRLNLKKRLSENSYQIFNYAFTEMLNNAIDHSTSLKATIEVEIKTKSIRFHVEDMGIGAFEKVRRNFKLANVLEGLEHLFKGKQTTDPTRHSGQGIFFTSRIADTFELGANGYNVRVLGDIDDVMLSEKKKIRGTSVGFEISKQSKRSLEKLFSKFTNHDFEFDKNHVRVKLSNFEGLLSRSQAKRLLNGLDKFSQIEFDFKDVKEIGQAFADEIFRIYARNHPQTILTYTHANTAIAFLIERARKT